MNGYPEGYGFEYIQLVRKSDNKEVYTSPLYLLEDEDSMDIPKIADTLNYYFDRINDGIMQQLQSPRLTAEQKTNLKMLDKADYRVCRTRCIPPGYGHFPPIWSTEATTFLKNCSNRQFK